MKAQPVLRATLVGLAVSAASSGALAQATPPSPFAPAEPSPAPAPLAVDPAEPAPPASAPLVQADPNETPEQRARRQVVALLRGGKPIGVGTVLSGDGRILTALSVLGHGNDVDARFADGTLARVRLVHGDRGWDLALVAAAARRQDTGLRASRGSALQKDAKLTAFSPGAKELASVKVRVKEAQTLVGGDSARLDGALVLESKHKASELGSPVIDERGDVVAVLAQACAPTDAKTCTLSPYAAPVAAIKDFLRTVGSAGPQVYGPLGVRGIAHDTGSAKGIHVLAIAPRSPAARSGLRAGVDTIVAVNGAPVTTPEQLADAVRARRGRNLELLVFGGGRYRLVELGAPERGGVRRVEPPRRHPRWPRRRDPDPGY